MTSASVKEALDHNVDEIWFFMEQHGVLRILERDGSIRLLMQNGEIIGTTLKELQTLLVHDRARLQQEASAARGRRVFVGAGTRYQIVGNGQVVEISDDGPRFAIVGRDKKRLEEINNEGRTLVKWKADVQKLLNFVAGGEIEIPDRFLPPVKKKLKNDSNDTDKIAEAFVAVCEQVKTFRPTLQQLSEHSGIPAKTIDRKLKTAETLIRLKRLVEKKINYTKPANQERKRFWFDVEQEVNAMAEALSTRRRSQRERTSDHMDRFPNNEDETE
jgi:hypothetical protein